MEDHRRVERLYEEFSGTDRADTDRRTELVNQIVWELSMYADIEERNLYPATAEAFPGGDQLAGHSIEEHQEIKETLDDIDETPADSDDLDRKLATLIAEVNEHVAEEEGELFPKLREALDEARLVQLSEQLEADRAKAPTRPHPPAPASGLGHRLADPAAAVLDRLRDKGRDYPGEGR